MLSRKITDMTIASANMYALNLVQAMVNFIWQDQLMEITQMQIIAKAGDPGSIHGSDYCYDVTAWVFDRGTLVTVSCLFDLSHHEIATEMADRGGPWSVVNKLWFSVRSVPDLKQVVVRFNVDKSTWGKRRPTMIPNLDSVENIRDIWRGLRLDTNQIVRTV